MKFFLIQIYMLMYIDFVFFCISMWISLLSVTVQLDLQTIRILEAYRRRPYEPLLITVQPLAVLLLGPFQPVPSTTAMPVQIIEPSSLSQCWCNSLPQSSATDEEWLQWMYCRRGCAYPSGPSRE